MVIAKLRECPNCGRQTGRTEDWACQWCGYPLLSASYKKIPKSYEQCKQERLSASGAPGVSSQHVMSETETGEELDAGMEEDTEPEPGQTSAVATEAAGGGRDTEQDAAMRAAPDVGEEAPAKPVVIEPGPVPARPVADETDEGKDVAMVTAPEPAAEPVAALAAEPASDGEAEPDMIMLVTVRELCAAYLDQGMAAHEEFRGRAIRVAGFVDAIIIKDVVGRYQVALTDSPPHPLGSVYCNFEKRQVPVLARLTAGQALTVDGTYFGFTSNIVLSGCCLLGGESASAASLDAHSGSLPVSASDVTQSSG